MKRNTFYFLLICYAVTYLGFSDHFIETAKSACFICAHTVVPSLFPFFVLSNLAVKTNFISVAAKRLSPFSKKILQLSGVNFVCFLIGLVCGYPTGAKLISDLVRGGKIKRKVGERLLPVCNHAGPVFVLGTVGAGFCHDVKKGMFLYAVQLSAAITCVAFCGRRLPKINVTVTESAPKSVMKAFAESVTESVETVLVVCGYIVFFSGIRLCVSTLFTWFCVPTCIKEICLPFLEITAGAGEICGAMHSPVGEVLLLSALIASGGGCVCLQITGISAEAGIGTGAYLRGKILQMIFAIVYGILGLYSPYLLVAAVLSMLFVLQFGTMKRG